MVASKTTKKTPKKKDQEESQEEEDDSKLVSASIDYSEEMDVGLDDDNEDEDKTSTKKKSSSVKKKTPVPVKKKTTPVATKDQKKSSTTASSSSSTKTTAASKKRKTADKKDDDDDKEDDSEDEKPSKKKAKTTETPKTTTKKTTAKTSGSATKTTSKSKGIMDSVVVFIDIHNSGDSQSSTDILEEKIKEMGGRVVQMKTKTVTHYIFLNGHATTVTTAQSNGKPLVSPLWVNECEKKKKLIDVKDNPNLLAEINVEKTKSTPKSTKKTKASEESSDTKTPQKGSEKKDEKKKKEKDTDTKRKSSEKKSATKPKKEKEEESDDEMIDESFDEHELYDRQMWKDEGFNIHTPVSEKKAKFIIERTHLSDDDEEMLQEIVDQSKHTKLASEDEYSGQRITHLIAPDNATKRTIKVFYAIAHGAYIVNKDWLTTCINNLQSNASEPKNEKYPSGEEPFLVKKWLEACERSRIAQLSFNKRKRMALVQVRETEGEDEEDLKIPHRLFHGLKITAEGDVNPKVKDLRKLVQLCGGEWVTGTRSAKFCIVGPNANSKPFKQEETVCVTVQWLLDSIEKYELVEDISKYLAVESECVKQIEKKEKKEKKGEAEKKGKTSKSTESDASKKKSTPEKTKKSKAATDTKQVAKPKAKTTTEAKKPEKQNTNSTKKKETAEKTPESTPPSSKADKNVEEKQEKQDDKQDDDYDTDVTDTEQENVPEVGEEETEL